MKIQCDVCEKQEASVFCTADEAALCEGCDHKVHHANKLATRHLRFSLLLPSFKDSPLCDICQEKRAFLFCKEDRAILCRECDIQIHKTNEHTQTHSRFLLSGVKISASSTIHPTKSPHSSSTFSGPNSGLQTRSSFTISYTYHHDMFNQHTTTPSSTTSTTNSTNYHNNQMIEEGISDFLMETLPGWSLEDLLDSSASHNFSKISDYTNIDQVDTSHTTQQVEEIVGGFDSENNKSIMWEFRQQAHNVGPSHIYSHLPDNFLQR